MNCSVHVLEVSVIPSFLPQLLPFTPKDVTVGWRSSSRHLAYNALGSTGGQLATLDTLGTWGPE